MPKSYKITIVEELSVGAFEEKDLLLTKQSSLPGLNPGPQTKIRRAQSPVTFGDFTSLEIEHEYPMFVSGRTFEDGRPFNKIIAKGDIRGYHSQERGLLLLQGKKSDILDFCRQTGSLQFMPLRTIEIDMKGLQEKLPEIRGVWFRFKSGFIRAKGYMGQSIQDTADYCDAKAEGDISTLSFYFEDDRDGCRHPVMITEDGTVVLQRNYTSREEEIDFVLHVKQTLLDGLFQVLEDPAKAKTHIAPEIS